MAIVIAAAVVIVAMGVVGTVMQRRPPGPATARAPEPSSGQLTAISPTDVMCHTLPDTECLAAIGAAERAIGDLPVAVEKARAWPSLLCRDDLDCPRALLAESDPVGSVELTYADLEMVWVNVFSIPEPNRLDENREVVAGRVVRWFRAGS